MKLADTLRAMMDDENPDPSVVLVLQTVVSAVTELNGDWNRKHLPGKPSVNDYARVAYAELRSKYDV